MICDFFTSTSNDLSTCTRVEITFSMPSGNSREFWQIRAEFPLGIENTCTCLRHAHVRPKNADFGVFGETAGRNLDFLSCVRISGLHGP